MNNTKTLKNCPCCDSQAEFFQSDLYRAGQDAEDDVGVKCTQCPLKIKFSNYAGYMVEEREKQALEAWNTRPEDTK